MFNFLRNHHSFPQMVVPFCIPTSTIWELQFLYILINTSFLFYYSHCSRYEVAVSSCGFGWAPFHVLIDLLMIFFWEMSIQIFCTIKNNTVFLKIKKNLICFIFGCAGYEWGLLCSCDERASHCGGFFCCGAPALGCVGFSSCATQA